MEDLAGWLIANLGVSLDTARQKSNADFDWLSIKLLLKKGNVDSIWLKDISIEVYDFETGNEIKTLSVTEFHAFNKINNKIDWKGKRPKEKLYAISPSETFQFGNIVKVPSGNPVMVEARVLGTRIGWAGGAQWRASVASLPVDDKTK